MSQINTTNLQVLLASRPVGAPKPDNFSIVKTPIPDLSEGQVLLKTLYLSLDPYMRGRMSDAPSYAAPVEVGGVMDFGADEAVYLLVAWLVDVADGGDGDAGDAEELAKVFLPAAACADDAEAYGLDGRSGRAGDGIAPPPSPAVADDEDAAARAGAYIYIYIYAYLTVCFNSPMADGCGGG